MSGGDFLRMEVARLFGVLPILLKPLPLTEYRKMLRYYNKVRESQESGGADGQFDIDVDALVARKKRKKQPDDGGRRR